MAEYITKDSVLKWIGYWSDLYPKSDEVKEALALVKSHIENLIPADIRLNLIAVWLSDGRVMRCSNCHAGNFVDALKRISLYGGYLNFCPYCGARMVDCQMKEE